MINSRESSPSGTVIPFERRRNAPTLPDTHKQLHYRTRQAKPAARELALNQASKQRDGYARAERRQREERHLRDGRPIPARITLALDSQGLDGPEVDTACGTVEPNVDLWECGLLTPTAEQVRLLAQLTGYPISYFYLPIEPGPTIGPIWFCTRRKCELVAPDVVDEHGVLHYGGEPRQPPKGWNGQDTLF